LLVFVFFMIIAHARLRVEAGVGTNAIGTRITDMCLFRIFGTKHMNANVLAGIAPISSVIGDTRYTGTMAGALECYYVADKVNVKRGSINKAIMIACVFGMIVSSIIGLNRIYDIGAYMVPLSFGIPRATYIASMNQAFQHNIAFRLDRAIISGVSMAFAGFLGFMRARFVGWPLHPFGYLAGVAPFGWLYTWSFLIAWLIKFPIYRYGGTKLYNYLKPLFLGVIIGPMVTKFLFGLVFIFIS
jgi:hypothetical protein